MARSATKLIVPIADDDVLVKGGKVYVEGCQGCHGELEKPFGEDHTHYPRAHNSPTPENQYTEPQIYWIVKHGIRMTAMSAYGRFYSEEQLWSIAAFLHRFQLFHRMWLREYRLNQRTRAHRISEATLLSAVT